MKMDLLDDFLKESAQDGSQLYDQPTTTQLSKIATAARRKRRQSDLQDQYITKQLSKIATAARRYNFENAALNHERDGAQNSRFVAQN